MRSTLDKLISWLGLALATVLAILAGLLFWASSFANSQVSDQLSAQAITMPAGPALDDPLIKPYLEQYAGQQMTTGPQAKAYADHYIKVHMDKSSGGKTYSQVSGEFMKLNADPAADKAAVAKLGDLRQSLFMGNSLRSMLLTAYAFDTMGTIARWAAIASLLGALSLLALAALGLRHAKAVHDEPVRATTRVGGYAEPATHRA